MKFTVLQKRLFMLTITTAVLCMLSFFFPKHQSLKAVHKTLVQSDKAPVTQIELTQHDRQLQLEKHGEIWTASDGSITVPADSLLVTGLLQALAKPRALYMIANTASALTKNDELYALTILQEGAEQPLNLYFGAQNSLLHRIALQVADEKALYETDDDMTQYLSTDVLLYADPALFWGIQSAVRISVTDYRSGAADARSRSYDEKSTALPDLSKKLLSYRHGALQPASAYSAADVLVAVITVEGSEGRMNNMSFFKRGSGSSADYYCMSRLTPSPIDGEKEADAMQQFSKYKAEISAWTFERILELFMTES